jgi:hypothetical protein
MYLVNHIANTAANDFDEGWFTAVDEGYNISSGGRVQSGSSRLLFSKLIMLMVDECNMSSATRTLSKTLLISHVRPGRDRGAVNIREINPTHRMANELFCRVAR